MSLSEMIDGFASALAATKNQLAQVTGEIEQAKAERNKIEWAPVHTEEIVAAFERGLVNAEASFLGRMSWFLSDREMREPGAAEKVGNAQPSLLMIGGMPPAADRGAILPFSALGKDQREIDVAAVTYFMRDIIRAQLPAMVERIWPAAKHGMKKMDRMAKLREVDSKLRKLEAEATRLKDEINAAIGAVRPAN
ncbi:hypothetical protein [Sphingobium ummariense]|uniref:Uncharacterized protein n=1 Tax=Sphingobium ummariense RL-3 TaxID=1346791 RepID=T0KD92_9SPHN|nr:hypothetical protein [Sphingobium ummariense]EQB31508.1 hypothetical protein M529_14415 [Sphingobium ummariense RL-3]